MPASAGRAAAPRRPDADAPIIEHPDVARMLMTMQRLDGGGPGDLLSDRGSARRGDDAPDAAESPRRGAPTAPPC